MAGESMDGQPHGKRLAALKPMPYIPLRILTDACPNAIRCNGCTPYHGIPDTMDITHVAKTAWIVNHTNTLEEFIRNIEHYLRSNFTWKNKKTTNPSACQQIWKITRTTSSNQSTLLITIRITITRYPQQLTKFAY